MHSVIISQNTYRITRKIADGGMGSVYEAVQFGVDGFEKIVAVKTLLPKLVNEPKFIKMFIQEAKLVANLVHENIVQIYQLGRQDDEYFIIMEYVQGISLHDFYEEHLRRKQPVPVEIAVFICSRIARGLAYAHTRCDKNGQKLFITHRDVSPKNVLITSEGLPKLGDFGLALVDAWEAGNQKTSLIGKLHYLSPEQAGSEEVDFRSDIYSLGVILFELLALKSFRSESTKLGLIREAINSIVDWSKLPAKLQSGVKTILEKCLCQRDARYSSSATLAHDLEYEIYKDGYGPTIQTLEKYLKNIFPQIAAPTLT